MEVGYRVHGNTFIVTGLTGLGREEVFSVIKQVLEKANVDSQIAFPEGNLRFGYSEIASEKDWDKVYNQIPSASAPIDYSPVTFDEHLANIDAERARRSKRDPQFEAMMMSEWSRIQQRMSDSFISDDPIQMEKARAFHENVEMAEEMADEMSISTLTGSVKATPSISQPKRIVQRPQVTDPRSDMPHFAEPPILPEEEIEIPRTRAVPVPPLKDVFSHDTGER